MRQITPNELKELIIDIENELSRLRQLEKQIKLVQKVKSLVENYHETWYQFKEDMEQFLSWLNTLANHLNH